jgi:hypothetical protein
MPRMPASVSRWLPYSVRFVAYSGLERCRSYSAIASSATCAALPYEWMISSTVAASLGLASSGRAAVGSSWSIRSGGSGPSPSALISSRRPRSHSSSAQLLSVIAGWLSWTDSLIWSGFWSISSIRTCARLL